MRRKSLHWTVLGVVVVSSLATAQFQPGRRGADRERLRENLTNLRLLRMTEALDLTAEQTAAIYPFATRLEKEKAGIIRDLGAEMADLRRLVGEISPKEADLAARVEAVRRLRRSLQEKDLEFERFLQANLSGIQVARYVIFQADFNQAMGERLNRARALTRGERRP